ncbi:hypothetical protein [Sodalinema gerasimenkoae]|uniref:hypothetical protein n=1 Tax=Sodalinema gerasimenkoae TaxID=2862348 RepID=UPI00135BF90B|nr:hypothetical protein [Sodalinema gerasimenkoae]
MTQHPPNNSSPSPQSSPEGQSQVQGQSSQEQTSVDTSPPGALAEPKSPDESQLSWNLFEDKPLWQVISVLVVLPILISAMLFQLVAVVNLMVDWVVTGVMFLGLMMLIGLLFATIPALIIWGIVETFRFMHRRGFDDFMAIALPISTVAFGISLGALLRPESFVLLWSVVTALTAIPLGGLLLYQPLRRAGQLKKYRKSQKHLIQP